MREAVYIIVLAFLICIAITSILFEQFYLGVILTSITVIYIAFLAWASANIRSGIFLKSISSVQQGELAITFDDGPCEQTTEFLDLLKKHNVRATFFLIGKNIKGKEAVVQRIVSEGHAIGSHSYEHNYSFAVKSVRKIEKDLLKCSEEIEKITGKKPHLFRPPFGVTTPRLARAVHNLGMESIGWTIRSNDGVEKDSLRIEKNLNRKEIDGSVVLFHDTNRNSLEPLKNLIVKSRDLGIELVTL